MLRHTRRTFSLRQPLKEGHGGMPFFAMAHIMNAICNSPATRIATHIAATFPRTSSESPTTKSSTASATIHTMFSMLGISAAAAKRPNEFITPIPNAAAQMNSM